MARQTFDVGGTKVRASTQEEAIKLANEITPTGVSVIAADSLNTTPRVFTPVPAPMPSTQVVGVSSEITSGADSFLQNLQSDATAKATDKTTSFAELMKSTLATEGETTLKDKLYSESVDPAQAELRDINQKILADEVATRRQIEELKKNTQGLEPSAITDKIGEIQDDALTRQADLAVIQMAKQGRADSARAIADRAVAAIVERQKTKNDALKFAYEEYKSDFTTAEQRAFETAQKDRERELNLKEFEVKARFAQNLEENSPTAQLDRQLKSLAIQKAGIELEALKNPVDTAGLDDATLARIEKLPLTAKDSLVNANDTIDQLTRIKTLVATTDLATLQNPLAPEGLLFRRLATDVADKMARERTGAVVTKEEQGNFKSILGLSFGARLVSDPTVVNAEVDKFINKHNQTRKLIDPTGKITEYLGQVTGDPTTSYVDSVSKSLGGSSPDALGSWLSGFTVK